MRIKLVDWDAISSISPSEGVFWRENKRKIEDEDGDRLMTGLEAEGVSCPELEPLHVHPREDFAHKRNDKKSIII